MRKMSWFRNICQWTRLDTMRAAENQEIWHLPSKPITTRRNAFGTRRRRKFYIFSYMMYETVSSLNSSSWCMKSWSIAHMISMWAPHRKTVLRIFQSRSEVLKYHEGCWGIYLGGQYRYADVNIFYWKRKMLLCWSVWSSFIVSRKATAPILGSSCRKKMFNAAKKIENLIQTFGGHF